MVKMSECTLRNIFNKWAGFGKDRIIAEVMKANGLSKETALNYYYQWKKIYVSSNNCIPKEIKKELAEQEKEEPPKDEAVNNPDAIIKAAREMHETSTEPIREFTAEEKEEIKAFVEAEMTDEPFEMSIVLKGKIFTYELNDSGVIVTDGQTDKITIECINEQQRALNAWNKYFRRNDLSIR